MLKSAFIMITLLAASQAKTSQAPWVDQLHNGNDNVCCFDNDGRRLTDPDWDTLGSVSEERQGPSGYRVMEDGKTYAVPNWAVVKQRNQDGIARVWWDRDASGGNLVKTVRCFIPGSLG